MGPSDFGFGANVSTQVQRATSGGGSDPSAVLLGLIVVAVLMVTIVIAVKRR